MKKIFFSIFLCAAASVTTSAQFVLNTTGFVDKNDETKDYIVIEMPGYSQQQLYSMVKSMVISNYVSPKTVLSDNEPVNLCITGMEKVKFSILINTFSYNVVFHFKDGKIKFHPKFISLKTPDGLEAGLFKNGKPRSVMKKTIVQCEDIINGIYEKSIAIKAPPKENW